MREASVRSDEKETVGWEDSFLAEDGLVAWLPADQLDGLLGREGIPG